MNKKLYWGLGVLFLLITGVFVLILVQQKAELAKLEVEFALPTEKVAENANKKPPQNEQEVETSHPHYHVHADGTPHVGTHETSKEAQGVPSVTLTSTGPLTYHAKLLETNPVKALRLLAEESGHAAAKWIPPFPPDDIEAQSFARNIYLTIYTIRTRADHSEYLKASIAKTEQLWDINEKYPYGARRCDLSKLIWVLGSIPVTHYDRGGFAIYPSDYFPRHISDLK